jgi:hypothetical protein
MHQHGFPLNLDSEGLSVRIPLPPEDQLLEMLFKHQEAGMAMGMVFEVQFDADFCEQMLAVHRNKVTRHAIENAIQEGSD